jgi:hypothetical protein
MKTYFDERTENICKGILRDVAVLLRSQRKRFTFLYKTKLFFESPRDTLKEMTHLHLRLKIKFYVDFEILNEILQCDNHTKCLNFPFKEQRLI